MAFRFSLQPVLRLRASYERFERLRLLALVAIVIRVRREIAALAHESVEAHRATQARLAAGLAGAELHLELAADKARTARKQSLEDQLAVLERKQESQRVAYHAARQKRQILENLRQRRWDEYRKEQSRREQQQLDELHLIHRSRKPPE